MQTISPWLEQWQIRCLPNNGISCTRFSKTTGHPLQLSPSLLSLLRYSYPLRPRVQSYGRNSRYQVRYAMQCINLQITSRYSKRQRRVERIWWSMLWMKRLIRRNLLYPLYRLYAWLNSWRHNYNEPLPAVPCQLCGYTGHVERLCPRKGEMGFLLERIQIKQ